MSLDAARDLAEAEPQTNEPDGFYVEIPTEQKHLTLRSVWAPWPQGEVADQAAEKWSAAILARLASSWAGAQLFEPGDQEHEVETGEIRHIDSTGSTFDHVEPEYRHDALGQRPAEAALEASVLRIGVTVGIGGIFASVALLLLSTALGLTGMYLGLMVFAFANYAAWLRGEALIIFGPSISAPLTFVSFVLAITCGLAAIFG